jgi:hypothetical protein
LASRSAFNKHKATGTFSVPLQGTDLCLLLVFKRRFERSHFIILIAVAAGSELRYHARLLKNAERQAFKRNVNRWRHIGAFAASFRPDFTDCALHLGHESTLDDVHSVCVKLASSEAYTAAESANPDLRILEVDVRAIKQPATLADHATLKAKQSVVKGPRSRFGVRSFVAWLNPPTTVGHRPRSFPLLCHK